MEVSLTEYPQFARLVQFLVECDEYAEYTLDIGLDAMVRKCRADLVALTKQQLSAP